MPVSPTAEGFRAAFRRPSLTLAEISWRWVAGATGIALFLFGLVEYLDSLPMTSGELLFLRTRQPYLVTQALAHILRGSLSRGVMAGLLAAMMLMILWIVVASVGRSATVRVLVEHFRRDTDNEIPTASPFVPLVRLNFLRAVLLLTVFIGLLGAAILAGFASPDANPQPGLAFFLFCPLAALICLIGWALNWLLSLAGMLAVCQGENGVGAIAAAVSLCRERTGAVFAVSFWTWLAHIVAFGGATTVVSMLLGTAGLLPGRLVALAVILLTLAYFVVADWLYMVRLAGYVCIVETPESLLAPAPAGPPAPPSAPQSTQLPLQTTIDRDEPILSDVPGLA